MKNLVGAVVGVALVVALFAIISKSYYINAGNVGVLIYKGGQNTKGVSDKPLTPGWGFRKLFTEDVQEYPVYVQTAIWTKSEKEGSADDESITANSTEGVAANIDVTVSYTLEASKVPDLYVKYRSDIKSIQNTFLRQTIRQAIQDTFGQYTVEDIYGKKKAEIASKTQALLVERVGNDGFNFQQFTINEVRLPQQIMDSINQKIQAGQDALRAEQVLKQKQIEADQQIAEAKGNAEARITNAKAEAEAIKIQAEAVTSQGGADYVKLKWIEAWAQGGSKVPQFITGNGEGFIFNMDKLPQTNQ